MPGIFFQINMEPIALTLCKTYIANTHSELELESNEWGSPGIAVVYILPQLRCSLAPAARPQCCEVPTYSSTAAGSAAAAWERSQMNLYEDAGMKVPVSITVQQCWIRSVQTTLY